MVRHPDGEWRADGELMPVRVYSDAPGLTDCYVEVADAWTVREVTALYESREQWLSLWRKKVLSVYLTVGDGETITDPADVINRFEDMDIRLARFVNNSLAWAVDHLATLGGTQRRISSGVGDSPRMKTTPT